MLKEIEFKNMKGQTATQPLSGMDIFIGRNGVGKTTRIQALGYGMLGYVPGQKKTSSDIFKMATGDNMSVGLKTERLQVVRSLTKMDRRNAKTGEVTTTIKESIVLSPGGGERNDFDRNIRIQAEFGNFPVMMDFTEFLNLSDTKRRDFIYGLSPIQSNTWDRQRIGEYLSEKLLTPDLKGNDYNQFVVMNELISKAVAEYPEGFGVQEGLRAMLDWAAAEKSIWDKKQKDAQGAVRQISEMKNELEETDRNIAASKKQLDEFHEQLIKMEKEITADEARKKAIQKRNERMNELRRMIEALEKETVQRNVAEIDKQIAEHQQQLVGVPDFEEKTKTIDRLKSEIQQQKKQLEIKRQGFKEKIGSVQSTVTALEEALRKTAELGGRCIINPMIKCEKDFTGFDGFVLRKRDEAATAVAELQAELEKVEAQIRDGEDKEKQLAAEQNEVLKKVQMANTRNTSINQSIAELTQKKNERLVEFADRDNKLKLYREELTKLLADPIEAVTGTELLNMHASGLRHQIEEIKKTVEGKEKAKQTLLLVQQSMLENRKAEYHAACLKLINESLGPKGVQGELVKEILEPIRQDIRNNLQLMGIEDEPFFQTESDTGKEIFQFGWINARGHQVNFDALSTGQQTIFLAAMMVTMIDRAQPRLRILVMDDLNHLDRENFGMLLDGLAKIKGKLDNIILAGAIAFSFDVSDWKIWDLGRKEAGVKESA
jgi:exonuclease SbcC